MDTTADTPLVRRQRALQKHQEQTPLNNHERRLVEDHYRSQIGMGMHYRSNTGSQVYKTISVALEIGTDRALVIVDQVAAETEYVEHGPRVGSATAISAEALLSREQYRRVAQVKRWEECPEEPSE